LDRRKREGQAELSRSLQIATAAVDSTGMCLFIWEKTRRDARSLFRNVSIKRLLFLDPLIKTTPRKWTIKTLSNIQPVSLRAS